MSIIKNAHSTWSRGHRAFGSVSLRDPGSELPTFKLEGSGENQMKVFRDGQLVAFVKKQSSARGVIYLTVMAKVYSKSGELKVLNSSLAQKVVVALQSPNMEVA